jgi:hypothetical protein
VLVYLDHLVQELCRNRYHLFDDYFFAGSAALTSALGASLLVGATATFLSTFLSASFISFAGAAGAAIAAGALAGSAAKTDAAKSVAIKVTIDFILVPL